MINHQTISQRKIQIKPIERIIPPQMDEQEDESSYIFAKLAQAKEALSELEKKEKQILADVRETIQREQAAWQEEKQQWVEAAKAEGYQAGFTQGEAAGEKTYQASIDLANHVVDLVKEDYQKTLEQTDDVIVQLGIHTAEKILEQKLEAEPDLFLNIVKPALKEIKDQSVVSIYLHPIDYETVLTQKDELKRILERDSKLSLYINDELEKHSCIIEHPFGQIDATVGTQLQKIRSALTELVMESK